MYLLIGCRMNLVPFKGCDSEDDLWFHPESWFNAIVDTAFLGGIYWLLELVGVDVFFLSSEFESNFDLVGAVPLII